MLPQLASGDLREQDLDQTILQACSGTVAHNLGAVSLVAADLIKHPTCLEETAARHKSHFLVTPVLTPVLGFSAVHRARLQPPVSSAILISSKVSHSKALLCLEA